MRKFTSAIPLVVLASAGVAPLVDAQPTNPPQPPSKPLVQPTGTLKVGDKAPPLSIGHWVKGDKVEKFEPGKVYVIEFWATWCGPCIQNIPHLTKMQKRFKDKGVTIIGVSSSDKQGVLDVKPFVDKMGKKMEYTVAVDDLYKTGLAYLGGTGQSGIPYSYVVDKKGLLAWHGHPMAGLDEVVKRAAAGTFDPEVFAKDQAAMRERFQRLNQAVDRQDWTGADAILDEWAKADPEKANEVARARFVILYGVRKDKDAAVELGSRLLGAEWKNDPDQLLAVVSIIANDPEATKAAKDLGVKMAERAAATYTDDPPAALSLLADMYVAAGDIPSAIKTQEGVVGASTDEGTKSAAQAKLDYIKGLAPKGTESPAKSAP